MNTTRPNLIAPLVMLTIVIALGAVMIVREPDMTLLWAFAMAIMPVCWFVIELLRFQGELSDFEREDRVAIRTSIAGAGLMLAVPLALTVLFTSGFETITDAFEKRAMGISFAVVMILWGNFVPKRAASLSGKECSPQGQQAFNRFSGLMFMTTGLLYGLIWAFAPLDFALPASMTVLGIGMAIMMGRATMKALRK